MIMPRESERGIVIYKTPLFERCLDDLRRDKGGAAAMAARKADEFIRGLVHGANNHDRQKFSYTWNGEYRIRNCKKVGLVGAYRLVIIQKDCTFIFLYAGSHDDCFRWIERNKGLTYEMDWASNLITTVQERREEVADALPEELLEERTFAEQYEKKLMERLDDHTLARIFSGLSASVRNKEPNSNTDIIR